MSPSSIPAGRATRPPSRVGKKGVTFYLQPVAVKQLRRLSVEEDTTMQALLVEATNMLFRSRDKPRSPHDSINQDVVGPHDTPGSTHQAERRQAST